MVALPTITRGILYTKPRTGKAGFWYNLTVQIWIWYPQLLNYACSYPNQNKEMKPSTSAIPFTQGFYLMRWVTKTQVGTSMAIPSKTVNCSRAVKVFSLRLSHQLAFTSQQSNGPRTNYSNPFYMDVVRNTCNWNMLRNTLHTWLQQSALTWGCCYNPTAKLSVSSNRAPMLFSKKAKSL